MQIQPFFARYLEGQKVAPAPPEPVNNPSEQMGRDIQMQTRKYPSDNDYIDVKTGKIVKPGSVPESATKPNKLAKPNYGAESQPNPMAKDPNPLDLWTRPSPWVKDSGALRDAGGTSSGSIQTMAFPSDSDAMEGRLRF